MAVALPADHPLAAATPIGLSALADDQWIAPHPCGCREALEVACRQAGFTPMVVSETNDYPAMLGLVAAGVGVAVVPRLIAALAVPRGVVLRPLAPGRLRRTVAAVTTRGGHRPPIRLKMIRLLQTMSCGLADPELPLSPAAADAFRSGTAA
jgi:DNA-binding transcriptional LysR family regulator